MEQVDLSKPLTLTERVNHIKKVLPFSVVAAKYHLRYGENRNFCCWFHSESVPSARVRQYDGGERYTCYAECGSGDVVWAIKKLEGFDTTKEAVEFIEQFFNISYTNPTGFCTQVKVKPKISLPRFYRSLVKSLPLDDEYLPSRGIGPSTVKFYGVRRFSESVYDEFISSGDYDAYIKQQGMTKSVLKDRILIPLISTKGVCGITARALYDQDPKYFYSVDPSLSPEGKGLFGLIQYAKEHRRGDPTIVVEGPIDAMSFHAVKPSLVALSTIGVNFTKTQVSELSYLYRSGLTNKFILMYDGDKAGRTSVRLLKEKLFSKGVPMEALEIVYLPEGQDPNSLLTSGKLRLP